MSDREIKAFFAWLWTCIVRSMRLPKRALLATVRFYDNVLACWCWFAFVMSSSLIWFALWCDSRDDEPQVMADGSYQYINDPMDWKRLLTYQGIAISLVLIATLNSAVLKLRKAD